jgi:hypothetical protein
MWEDPIVAEIQAVREEMAARFNYDVRALGQYFMSLQRKKARKAAAKTSSQKRRKINTIAPRNSAIHSKKSA